MASAFLTQPAYSAKPMQESVGPSQMFLLGKQRERKWANLLRKISFEPQNEDFYNEYPLKPGFNLWRTLATCNLPPKLLKGVRLPSTFVVLGNNNHIWLKYDEKRNCLSRRTELQSTVNDFEGALPDSSRRKLNKVRFM